MSPDKNLFGSRFGSVYQFGFTSLDVILLWQQSSFSPIFTLYYISLRHCPTEVCYTFHRWLYYSSFLGCRGKKLKSLLDYKNNADNSAKSNFHEGKLTLQLSTEHWWVWLANINRNNEPSETARTCSENYKKGILSVINSWSCQFSTVMVAKMWLIVY